MNIDDLTIGQARSEAKTAAARENAKKPRRKWVTSIAYEVEGVPQHLAFGSVLVHGKPPEGADASMEWCERKVCENGVGLGNREFILFSKLSTTSISA